MVVTSVLFLGFWKRVVLHVFAAQTHASNPYMVCPTTKRLPSSYFIFGLLQNFSGRIFKCCCKIVAGAAPTPPPLPISEVQGTKEAVDHYTA